MIAALLLAAAAPAGMTAIEAERAFAADAQKLGQWTAFQKWSTADALMFLPQPTKAHSFFKDRKDPPEAVIWWPGRSYVSCDGSYAINTGPWVREWGKSVGYFTTVWQRQRDRSWKWIYDAGDELTQPRAEGGDIKARTASCRGRPTNPVVMGTIGALGYRNGGSRSRDGTLVWSWTVGPKGDRRFLAQMWNGEKFETVVEDRVAAAP